MKKTIKFSGELISKADHKRIKKIVSLLKKRVIN